VTETETTETEVDEVAPSPPDVIHIPSVFVEGDDDEEEEEEEEVELHHYVLMLKEGVGPTLVTDVERPDQLNERIRSRGKGKWIRFPKAGDLVDEDGDPIGVKWVKADLIGYIEETFEVEKDDDEDDDDDDAPLGGITLRTRKRTVVTS